MTGDMKKTVKEKYLGLFWCQAWLGGMVALLCGSCSPPDMCPAKLAEAQSQNQQLQKDLEQQRAAQMQLQRELEQFRGMPDDRREQLVQVAGIEFGRFTDAVDRDKDGFDDGVKVYLVLRDREGDVIKAAGTVDLELWDLDAAENQRRYQHHFDLKETAGCWLSGMMADHFKFEIPWAKNTPPRHANLTIKLTYTDALTAKSWQIQKMITVKLRS